MLTKLLTSHPAKVVSIQRFRKLNTQFLKILVKSLLRNGLCSSFTFVWKITFACFLSLSMHNELLLRMNKSWETHDEDILVYL